MVSERERGIIGRFRRVRSHPLCQRTAIALGGASQFGAIMFLGTAMAVYVGERASPFAVSMVLSSYFVGMVVFAPAWGVIADVTGRRRAVMLLVSVAATLVLVPLVFVEDVWLQIGFRGVFSVFTAGFLPIMLTLVSERGRGQNRGRSIGFFTSMRSIGAASSQFTAGVLLGFLFPSQLYVFAVGISAITVLSVLLLEDPTPDAREQLDRRELLARIHERILPTAMIRRLEERLRWLYVILVVRNVTVMGVMSLMPVYLLQDVGSSEYAMGVILGLGPAIQIVSMYVVGSLSEGVGRKPLLVVGAAGSAFFPLIVTAALVAPEVLVREVIVGSGFVVKALSYSALTIGSVTFIGDVADEFNESELMGLRSTAKGVGGIIGPALIGGVATVFSIEAAFVVGGVLLVVGVAVFASRLTETNPAIVPADD